MLGTRVRVGDVLFSKGERAIVLVVTQESV